MGALYYFALWKWFYFWLEDVSVDTKRHQNIGVREHQQRCLRGSPVQRYVSTVADWYCCIKSKLKVFALRVPTEKLWKLQKCQILEAFHTFQNNLLSTLSRSQIRTFFATISTIFSSGFWTGVFWRKILLETFFQAYDLFPFSHELVSVCGSRW